MPLIICPYCNNKISDRAEVCPKCNSNLDKLVSCPECGAIVLPEMEDCPTCGYPLVPSCPDCGKRYLLGSRLCTECGYPFESHKLKKEKKKSSRGNSSIGIILAVMTIVILIVGGVIFFIYNKLGNSDLQEMAAESKKQSVENVAAEEVDQKTQQTLQEIRQNTPGVPTKAVGTLDYGTYEGRFPSKQETKAGVADEFFENIENHLYEETTFFGTLYSTAEDQFGDCYYYLMRKEPDLGSLVAVRYELPLPSALYPGRDIIFTGYCEGEEFTITIDGETITMPIMTQTNIELLPSGTYKQCENYVNYGGLSVILHGLEITPVETRAFVEIVNKSSNSYGLSEPYLKNDETEYQSQGIYGFFGPEEIKPGKRYYYVYKFAKINSQIPILFGYNTIVGGDNSKIYDCYVTCDLP